MRRGRIVIALALLVSAISLLGATAARAATPQDICKDLADGKVDGTYTSAEWSAFFNDPTIQGYGCSGVVVPGGGNKPVVPVVVSAAKGASRTAPTATGVKGAQHSATSAPRSAVAPLSTAKKAGTLPFTGAQLALFLLVGLGLVATGIVLRVTGRRRPEA